MKEYHNRMWKINQNNGETEEELEKDIISLWGRDKLHGLYYEAERIENITAMERTECEMVHNLFMGTAFVQLNVKTETVFASPCGICKCVGKSPCRCWLPAQHMLHCECMAFEMRCWHPGVDSIIWNVYSKQWRGEVTRQQRVCFFTIKRKL